MSGRAGGYLDPDERRHREDIDIVGGGAGPVESVVTSVDVDVEGSIVLGGGDDRAELGQLRRPVSGGLLRVPDDEGLDSVG